MKNIFRQIKLSLCWKSRRLSLKVPSSKGINSPLFHRCNKRRREFESYLMNKINRMSGAEFPLGLIIKMLTECHSKLSSARKLPTEKKKKNLRKPADHAGQLNPGCFTLPNRIGNLSVHSPPTLSSLLLSVVREERYKVKVIQLHPFHLLFLPTLSAPQINSDSRKEQGWKGKLRATSVPSPFFSRSSSSSNSNFRKEQAWKGQT